MQPIGRIIGAPLPCEGLAGPIGERTVLGVQLATWQQAAMKRAGLRPSDTTPDATMSAAEQLLAAPHHFFSTRAVQVALKAGRAAGKDVVCLPDSVGAQTLNALTAEAAGLVYLRAGGDPDVVARMAAAERLAVPAEEREIPGFDLGGGPLRVADAWVLPVGHWVQLLWANLYALGPHLWGELAGQGAGALLRLGWAALVAGSMQPENVAAQLVRRGAGSKVHRDATVEGVILGAGARIGAGAVVRGAILGPGAVVEELAVVEGVVMGAGARVQRQALAKFMVIEAGAAHAGIAQLGVLGEGAQVKNGATLMDMAFGQDVRVRVGGALRAAPHGICGVCVGPRTIVGSGVRVAPGRALPADLAVLADPGSVLTRVDLPGGIARVVVRNGALEPA